MRTWCQKDSQTLFAKGDRLANSRDVNPLETIWIIVNEMTYKVIHTCITTFATIRKITHS